MHSSELKAHNQRTQKPTQMSLSDTVAFIAIREADAIAAKAKTPTQTTNSNMMLKHDKRGTKDRTNLEAQDATSLKVTPPSQMPPEQIENVKMHFTVNININAGPATNINHTLRRNAEPPECHTAGGCCHGRATPRVMNTPSKAQSRVPARGRQRKPIPVAGVMRQQGIPRLDPTCMTARGQSQLSTKTHAKRRHGAKGWRTNNKTPSKRMDGLTAGALNATNNPT